jgi:uncharacterized protein (DUF1778 family)
MTTDNARSERINMRITSDSLQTLREAAAYQQQDLSAFVLGSALENARAVLLQEHILKLTPHEINQLERALDAPTVVAKPLADLIASVRQQQNALA